MQSKDQHNRNKLHNERHNSKVLLMTFLPKKKLPIFIFIDYLDSNISILINGKLICKLVPYDGETRCAIDIFKFAHCHNVGNY